MPRIALPSARGHLFSPLASGVGYDGRVTEQKGKIEAGKRKIKVRWVPWSQVKKHVLKNKK